MSNGKKYAKILEPGRIGKVITRNRMVKSGAQMVFDDMTGDIGEKHLAFYERLAEGGVGLIIVESTAVDYPLGVRRMPQSHIEDDSYIPSYAKLVEVIHRHGCPTFLQVFHAGPWHQSQVSGLQPISSSTYTEKEMQTLQVESTRELKLEEIPAVVDLFVKAAERGVKAGFDGIEVNAGTCHLLNSFLSRAWNKRQDAYGYVDIPSRARIVTDIIKGIKKRIGADYPVSVLINGAEYGLEKGTTSAESVAIAVELVKAGADAINVRAFGYGPYTLMLWPEQLFYPERPKSLPEGLDWSHRGAGALVPLAAAIKKAVPVPVITAGRFDYKLGNSVLEQNKLDFIAMTRCLFADPDYPKKVAEGRFEDIAPCTACLACADAVVVRRQPMCCRVNAALGKEKEYSILQATNKKRVMVIGGGPAGMEAARRASLMGHSVVLYEKSHKLGGLLPVAALVKGTNIEDLVSLNRYLERQLIKGGVEIHLGVEANPSTIEAVKPDVVILADGGKQASLDIPGINRRNVIAGSELHHTLERMLRYFSPGLLRWLTQFWMPVGKRVVILGSAIQGCQLAQFLVERNRSVTIVDTEAAPGNGLDMLHAMLLIGWLSEHKVRLTNGIKYDQITDKGLIIINKTGQKETIEADTIILALPLVANIEPSISATVPVYPIGDSRKPGLIIDAIGDACLTVHTKL